MPTLPSETRATVFAELAAMLNAGMSLEQALQTMTSAAGRKQQRVTDIAKRMLAMVRNGQSLTASGRRTELFDGLDRELVHCAEQAGTVGPTLARLAEWHQGRQRRANKVKAGLYLPAGVVVLGALAAPLPELIGGQMSAGQYLLQVVWFLGPVAALGLLLWQLPGWLRDQQIDCLDTLRIRMPVLGEWHVRRQVLTVLDAFEMLYSAGVTPDQALAAAAANASNSFIRESFDDTRARMQHGMPLGQAFADGEYLTSRSKQFVTSGDSAGQLSDMLRRNSALEGLEVEAFDDQVATWIPRLVYMVVAGWMITNIL
jgi:general secretion pathway protein F